MRRVFRHHHGLIDEDADADGDAGQAHDVRRHAEQAHHQEAEENGHRQRDRDNEGPAEVPHHDQNGDRADDQLLADGTAHGLDGPVDQWSPIVEGHDPDALGQARLKGSDFLLDLLSDRERVPAEAHHHHSPDDLLAVLLQDAAAKRRTDLHSAEGFHVDRSAVPLGDYRAADVVEALDPADRTDQVLGVPLVDDPAADGRIRPGDGGVDLTQADAVSAELVGVEVDLVFLGSAADGGDFRHTRHAVELVAYIPVLNGTELAQVPAVPLDRVPEDLADSRGVGGEVGNHTRGKERGGDRQPLEHAGASEVVVGRLVEDDRDHREVELARRADDLDAGQPLKVDRQGVSDLVFDLLGAAAHPVREYDDLVFGQVGNGINGRGHHGTDAGDTKHQGRKDDEITVADRPLDDRLDHDKPPFLRSMAVCRPGRGNGGAVLSRACLVGVGAFPGRRHCRWIEPAFGVDQESAGRRHLVAWRETVKNGKVVADPRAENDLSTFEDTGLGFDVDNLAITAVDHRRFGYREDAVGRRRENRQVPGRFGLQLGRATGTANPDLPLLDFDRDRIAHRAQLRLCDRTDLLLLGRQARLP